MFYIIIISLFIGAGIAFIQQKYLETDLNRRVFRTLGFAVIMTMIPGVLLYILEILSVSNLYLLLIICIVSAGLFVFMERLILKFWWILFVSSLLCGLICNYFMEQNGLEQFKNVMILAFVPAVGYYLVGRYKNIWKFK